MILSDFQFTALFFRGIFANVAALCHENRWYLTEISVVDSLKFAFTCTSGLGFDSSQNCTMCPRRKTFS